MVSLYPYQKCVTKWFIDHPRQKGLIVHYGTGTGKTILAVHLAETLLNKKRVDNVHVVTPKSLTKNFQDAMHAHGVASIVPYSIETYGCMANRVTAASSTTTKLKRGTKRPHSVTLQDCTRESTKSSKTLNTLVIVDEAHNFRSIGSKRTRALIELTMNAKHVLLLTATPFVNSVTDVSPLMRMISHDTPDVRSKWPYDALTFRDMYMSNPYAYRNAIRNKVACYSGDNKSTSIDIMELNDRRDLIKGCVPSNMGCKPTVVHHESMVELSKDQIDEIRLIRKSMSMKQMRTAEKILTSNKGESTKKTDMESINSFLVRIRQISNTLRGVYSQKLHCLVAKSIKGPKPAIIYSEFRENGVEAVMACLVENGVLRSSIAYFHGDLTAEERDDIVKLYNKGEYEYILITSAGSEGISLRSTRQVHVLEPYWNIARIMQVLGRGVRVDSHGHLAESDQRVDVWHWLSVLPKSNDKKGMEFTSILEPDVHVWAAAKKKWKEFQAFNLIHRMASIPVTFETYRHHMHHVEFRVKSDITKHVSIPRKSAKI